MLAKIGKIGKERKTLNKNMIIEKNILIYLKKGCWKECNRRIV